MAVTRARLTFHNTAQRYTLFALSSLWRVRGQLLPAKG